MSAFSKKNMIFCPLFPRKYAAKVLHFSNMSKFLEQIIAKFC